MLDITTGVQSPTSVGAITGSLDVSTLTGNWAVIVLVTGLASGKKAKVVLEDTAHATPFSEALPVAVWDFQGPLDGAKTQTAHVFNYDVQARVGATNNKFRLYLAAVDATPGLKIQAHLISKLG